MICHLATFILLGLGSVYENSVLTFLSLVTLMLGLFFGKEAIENIQNIPEWADYLQKDDDDDPPLGIG